MIFDWNICTSPSLVLMRFVISSHLMLDYIGVIIVQKIIGEVVYYNCNHRIAMVLIKIRLICKRKILVSLRVRNRVHTAAFFRLNKRFKYGRVMV